MKKMLFSLMAIVLFSFNGNSQGNIILKTIENSNLGSTNFLFNFNEIDAINNAIIGKLSIGNQIVNAKMGISSGLNISEIRNISKNEVSFKNNNDVLTLKIISSKDNLTVIRLKTKEFEKDFDVNAFVTFENFAEVFQNNSPNFSKACPPCVVVVVGIVVGGAYCAWKQYNASNSCLQAYQSCVNKHGNCSYEFESSTCGGTCSVNPH